MKTENSVQDGKLSDEQLGCIFRRSNEIVRRLNEGTLVYDDVTVMFQQIIEGKHKPFLEVVRRTHEIILIEHAIDCNADPFIPNGWSVEEHQKDGIIKFDASEVELYLSKKQKKENAIAGHKLRAELSRKNVLNANVLDYLLKNQHLIPKEWKGKTIFFWGTIYRNSGGDLCVRCFGCGGGWWGWGFKCLVYGFFDDSPAASLAS